jgi:hypothetical protein
LGKILLKKTGAELDLLTDYDMFLFIKKGLRGGISMVSQRYAKANNLHIEGYIPEKPTTHLMYYDANNPYGWGMSQPLARGGFEWFEEDIFHHPDDAEKGYILEVDLEYPKELHNSHSAYPLAPERMKSSQPMPDDIRGVKALLVLQGLLDLVGPISITNHISFIRWRSRGHKLEVVKADQFIAKSEYRFSVSTPRRHIFPQRNVLYSRRFVFPAQTT